MEYVARSGPLDCATGRFHVCETLPEELNAQIIVNGAVTSWFAYAFHIEGYLQSKSNPNRRVAFNIFRQGRTIVAGPDLTSTTTTWDPAWCNYSTNRCTVADFPAPRMARIAKVSVTASAGILNPGARVIVTGGVISRRARGDRQ